MPGELLSQPNPPPDPSLLPDSIINYGIKLNTTDFLSKDEHKAVHLFRRAADYIATGSHIFFFGTSILTSL
jgi:xylulose-5-phosphate/fructose-6-phosphate phosphoketolase